MSEYGPQDPRILIGKRHGCLLPPRPVSKLGDPLRNRIGSSVSRKHGGASSLDQQHPQVSVAALRYVPSDAFPPLERCRGVRPSQAPN